MLRRDTRRPRLPFRRTETGSQKLRYELAPPHNFWTAALRRPKMRSGALCQIPRQLNAARGKLINHRQQNSRHCRGCNHRHKAPRQSRELSVRANMETHGGHHHDGPRQRSRNSISSISGRDLARGKPQVRALQSTSCKMARMICSSLAANKNYSRRNEQIGR